MKACAIALAVACLCGCANFNTAFRTYGAQKKSAVIDVKQRAILTAMRPGSGDKTDSVICAEPSPDALSAYAASLAGKVDVPQQVSGELATSLQEGASYIGLRTQSIQLLRDSLYRLCEGYMNGAISKTDFQKLSRRYQKNMVALLAIEQLTGTVKVPPVTISTQSHAVAAQAVEALLAQQQRLREQKAAKLARKVELEAIIDAPDKKPTDEGAPTNQENVAIQEQAETKKAARSELTVLVQVLEDYDKALASLSKAIENPDSYSAGGSAGGQIGADANSRPDAATIATVSQVVKFIVQKTFWDNDEVMEMCARRFEEEADSRAALAVEKQRASRGESTSKRLEDLKDRVFSYDIETNDRNSIRSLCMQMIRELSSPD